ncbi:MAG: hypothetical protein Kapaf2KO_07990 [Candidatus Kapaibacteriales bacterium]
MTKKLLLSITIILFLVACTKRRFPPNHPFSRESIEKRQRDFEYYSLIENNIYDLSFIKINLELNDKNNFLPLSQRLNIKSDRNTLAPVFFFENGIALDRKYHDSTFSITVFDSNKKYKMNNIYSWLFSTVQFTIITDTVRLKELGYKKYGDVSMAISVDGKILTNGK